MRTVLAALAVTLFATPAAAQSMTPMAGTVNAFGDEFAVRVSPHNPYGHRIGVRMRVYDHTFRPVPEARVVPADFQLGSGGSRPVIAYVPFGGEAVRYVRVCAERIPFAGGGAQIRTRVCGKFQALRR